MNSTIGNGLGSFMSSAELENLLYKSAKRNSLIAAVCCLVVAVVGVLLGYGLVVAFFPLLLSFLFFFLSGRTKASNFRKYERITFLMATLVVGGLLFATTIATTLVVFLPCLAYLFFVEGNKVVRWSTVAFIVIAMLVSGFWFFPNLSVGPSEFDLRFEALFDVLVAALFTGGFVRFHTEFMQRSIVSAKLQEKNHKRYVEASKVAYDSLAAQKINLDEVYEASRVALLNERLAHAQIAASQDQLEQFAYAASHDLKEPIRTIKSFLQVVRRRLPDELVEEENLAEHFEFVEQGSESMHLLLERLLVYSRIDRVSKTKKLVGVVNTLQRLCSAPELKLAELGVEVSVNLPDDLSEVAVYMNGDHLMAILKELLGNAILFRSRERELEVEVDVIMADDKTLLISFSDNGIGIEDQYHEQVFGLFKRLNAREDYPGSGLGLSLVRTITESADGEVSLTSVLGRGTQVHLLLPRKAPEE